jgi:hypothetical protein
MVLKLMEAAQKSWRRLDGNNQLPRLILGVKFTDWMEVVAKQASPSHAGLLSSANLESDSCQDGNPDRFSLFGKCSKCSNKLALFVHSLHRRRGVAIDVQRVVARGGKNVAYAAR